MSDQDGVTKTRTEQLKSHLHMQVKQHIIFDGQGRPQFVFTAPIDAKEDTPCTVTEYVYVATNSTQVFKRQEREYRWKAAWNTGFVFDPAVNYDPDGDGAL